MNLFEKLSNSSPRCALTLQVRGRLGALILVPLVFGAVACGEDGQQGAANASDRHGAATTSTTNLFAAGIPTSSRAEPEPPPRPGSLGAAAESSIRAVVELHNVISAAYTNANSAPPGAIEGQAQDVEARLTQIVGTLGSVEADEVSRMLGEVVNQYATFARSLIGTSRLERAVAVSQLQRLDAAFKTAIEQIDLSTGGHFAAGLPSLSLPPEVAPAGAPPADDEPAVP